MKRLLDILSVIMIAVALFLIITHFGRVGNPYNERDTLTIVTRDTIEQIDTLYLTKTNTVVKPTLVRDTLIVQNDNTIAQKQYNDTICLDEDTVIALSYISGQNAKLDSLSVQLKKTELTKERTITVEKTIYQPQPRRFKDRLFIAPSVGVGYGLINKQADIYVGVSAGVKLF